MGVSYSAHLAVGISMAKLFTEFKEISDVHDEYDKFGKKTGKQFKEDKLIGCLPNGKEVVISEKKDQWGWKYNWYNSIGFDGGEYGGDRLDIKIGLHYGNYETNDLSEMIMGIIVSESDANYGDSKSVSMVDEDITNAAVERCNKELAELFGYTGVVALYLISSAG